MDVLWNVLLLVAFLLSSVMVFAAYFTERGLWGVGGTIAATILFLALLLCVVNNYLGSQTIVATVYEVNKTDSDMTVKVEVSSTPKAEIEQSNTILKAYKVAVYPSDSKRLVILSNDNSLWRLKFNKREIQLQLEKDKQYSFRIYRWVFGKNILSIEAQ